MNLKGVVKIKVKNRNLKNEKTGEKDIRSNIKFILILFVLFLLPVPCRGDIPELTELSLEKLMNIDVTSVFKKAQKLSEAAAAVFVITQEDIRRSGATCILEPLRMVPGLQVARIDANKWAISSRGFNGRWARKLLVLMDGRTIYIPSFSGVYWHMQDTLLGDIDRIEVIRGPGATLWGANDDLWSFFIQDERSFLNNSLSLVVRSKFEYNDYTGFEIQPNIRFQWAIDGSTVCLGFNFTGGQDPQSFRTLRD